MFLDANTACEDASVQDLTLPTDHPLPYIQDVSNLKSGFALVSRRDPLSLQIPTTTALSGDDVSVMEISETESAMSEDEIISSPLSSGSSSVEQLDQFEDAVMQQEVAITYSEDIQLPEAPAESPADTSGISIAMDDAVLGEAIPHPLPTQATSNSINPFGPWSQPLDQNTATIVWDEDDSDSDDGLFVPSFSHVHMAFHNAIQSARAYCEVITAFTLARQVHRSHFVVRAT